MSLEIVRGIDVCADELGVPVWVLAPLLRAVRCASEEASNTLYSALGVEVPPLHTTVHAGEDFVHLLTGLREVDEAIYLLALHEGDRIGHGLSLGVDAFEWARRAGRVAMPREVRLFDLAWEWLWYRRSRTPVPKGRRNLLELEIAHLSERIFGRRCDRHDVIHLVEDLNDGKRLWEIGFPNGPPPLRKKGTRRFEEREQADSRYLAEDGEADWAKRDCLLRAYLESPRVFQSGQEVQWVEPESEGEALAQIQAAIRANLAARGITVEVNPSSNLLIGDLGEWPGILFGVSIRPWAQLTSRQFPYALERTTPSPSTPISLRSIS